MMFQPDNLSYPADHLNLSILNRAKRHPITDGTCCGCSDMEVPFGFGYTRS